MAQLNRIRQEIFSDFGRSKGELGICYGLPLFLYVHSQFETVACGQKFLPIPWQSENYWFSILSHFSKGRVMSQDYQYADYNRGGMLAFSFSMAITLVFFLYVAFIHSGVDLKEIQPPAEKTEAATPAPEAAPAE